MFPPHLTPKQRGEIAELCFFLASTRHGYSASKPWGDSDPYDCVIEAAGCRPDARHKLSRVQVRSASNCNRGCYLFRLLHRTGNNSLAPYTPLEIEFFALYIDPEQLWYIIPLKEVAGREAIALSPRGRSKYNKFMEAWSLLGQPLRPSLYRPQYSVDLIASLPAPPAGIHRPMLL